MDHKTKADGVERPPRHDELVAFDPDEFATTFNYVMNAVSGEAHLDQPIGMRFTLMDGDQEMQLQFLDSPPLRIALALKDRYLDVSRVKYYSAFLRILALIDLVRAGGLEPWIRPAADGSGRTEIQESVVAAAAQVRLTRRLQFPVREFMRRVRQIEAGPDWETPPLL